jgi:rubrerythrin
MHDMSAGNLRSAFGGESMAHMRYKVWADVAVKEGFPNVARMFTAISRAEQAHATNHFQALREIDGAFLVPSMAGFGVGTTSENLAGAIDGEVFEINEMYPAYLEVAKMQKEKAAILSFHYALSAEKIHAAMYTKAKEAVDAGKDVALGAVHICKVCGHTVEGDVPDRCPVCNAGKADFVTFA